MPITAYELVWNPGQGPGYRILTQAGWSNWISVSPVDFPAITAILSQPHKVLDPNTQTLKGHP